MEGFDQRVKESVLEVAGEKLDGVLTAISFISGVLPGNRSRFFARASPELIGRAFFLVRTLPRPPRPRFI